MSSSHHVRKGLTPEEAEMLVLHSAVNRADEIKGIQLTSNPEVQKMIGIVEKFIERKKLVLYGGAAINLSLPVKDQFYDQRKEIPDYDFYSDKALLDAQELADIYSKAGYDVEARSGVHHGTYKVVANFIPIADITQMEPKLFATIQENAVKVKVNKGTSTLLVAPPDLLRMSMYLELSRPQGDTSRYEKVLTRLNVFNQHHPINIKHKNACFKNTANSTSFFSEKDYRDIIRKLIQQKVVFFGSFAAQKYFATDKRLKSKTDKLQELPFDLLSNRAEANALELKDFIQVITPDKQVHMKVHTAVGETLPQSFEVFTNDDNDNKYTIAIYFEPLACHNYNIVPYRDGLNIKIATTDTMLSFYFAFVYANKPHADVTRIQCMAHYLFNLQKRKRNRGRKSGIFRRFNLSCIGRQQTLESILLKKAKKFQELKENRKSEEFKSWFLKYEPVKTHKKKNKKTKRFPQLESNYQYPKSMIVTTQKKKPRNNTSITTTALPRNNTTLRQPLQQRQLQQRQQQKPKPTNNNNNTATQNSSDTVTDKLKSMFNNLF